MLSHVSNGSLPLDPQISVFYPKQGPCVFITDGVNLVVMQNYLFQWNFLLIILNVQICKMHIKAAILKDHLQLVALSTLYCAVITTSHLQKSFRLAELKLYPLNSVSLFPSPSSGGHHFTLSLIFTTRGRRWIIHYLTFFYWFVY